MDRAIARLDNRLTAADTAMIEKAVAAKVPRPTADERREALIRKAALVGWEWLSPDEQALIADQRENFGETSVERVRRLSGDVRHCSFCGKAELDVGCLVEGTDAFICDECIETAAAMVAARKASAP